MNDRDTPVNTANIVNHPAVSTGDIEFLVDGVLELAQLVVADQKTGYDLSVVMQERIENLAKVAQRIKRDRNAND